MVLLEGFQPVKQFQRFFGGQSVRIDTVQRVIGWLASLPQRFLRRGAEKRQNAIRFGRILGDAQEVLGAFDDRGRQSRELGNVHAE